jgi:hypothetical protein
MREKSFACIYVQAFFRPATFTEHGLLRTAGRRDQKVRKCIRACSQAKSFDCLRLLLSRGTHIAGEDGKIRPAPFLPESFWYSKVACLLSLEASNERLDSASPTGGFAPPDARVILTNFSEKPFPDTELSEGRVGRRELGVSRNLSLQ